MDTFTRWCRVLTLGALLVAGGAIPDLYFDQILSHQSVYADSIQSPSQTVLPFNARISDLIYDANGFCFVAVTEDGVLWSSRRKDALGSRARPPGPLDSPYGGWTKVADLSIIVDNESKISLTKRPDSIVLVTSTKLVEVVMDFTCSTLVVQRRRAGSAEGWGDVTAIASDSTGLWMGTRQGLLYVDTSAAESPEDTGEWSVLAVSDVPLNETVTSLLWAGSWSILFVGTTHSLYELRFYDSASPAAVLQHQYAVREEWIGGNIDLAICT